LVSALTGAICLGVIYCADVLSNVEEAIQFCREFGGESGVSVRDDLLGDSIVWYHVYEE